MASRRDEKKREYVPTVCHYPGDRYNINGNQPLYVHEIYSYQQAAGWEKSFMNRNEASQYIYKNEKKKLKFAAPWLLNGNETGNKKRLFAITNSEQPSDVVVNIMDKKWLKRFGTN